MVASHLHASKLSVEQAAKSANVALSTVSLVEKELWDVNVDPHDLNSQDLRSAASKVKGESTLS